MARTWSHGGSTSTARLTQQGRYTLGFVAHVATAKYLDHLPLYRQTQQMARQGLTVTTSTLCDQLEELALLLRPSYQALHAEVIAEPVVGVDETPWPVLEKADQRWWAWSVTSRNAVYYRIAKSRSHRDADKILEGFSGVAVCDAYSAYTALRSARGAKGEKLALATCWAHARRRFVKAEQHQPQAAAALEMIGRLYAVEAKAREFAEPGTQPWRDKLTELRATESVAALNDLDAWRASATAMPRSGLGKAIKYLDNQRRGLRMFLRNPLIPLDNNDAERAMRAELAPRCGLAALRRGETKRRLNWSSATSSMRMLIPDSGLRGPERIVWVDAKYKAHLQLLTRRGWAGLGESVRDAHRADLHQALAYAALDDVERVDSVLVYPRLGSGEATEPAVATLAAGRRRVRLVLLGLPFGFASVAAKEAELTRWRGLLAA